MTDTRQKNGRWLVSDDGRGARDVYHAQLAVLMDIRDELQGIHGLLRCHRIPAALDAIRRMDRDGIKRRVVRKRKGRK